MPANESHLPVPRLHLLHSWTRWSAPTTIPYRIPKVHATGDAPEDHYFTFTRDEQYRSCVVCGAEQMREVD